MDGNSSLGNRLKKPNYSFTCIVNALLRDPNISLKAKGLYSVMFSKPNDWVFYEVALVKESRDGRDAVPAGLDELEKAGWLSRIQSREKDSFSRAVFELHTVAGKSGDGKAANGKSAPRKADIIKTKSVIPPTPNGEPNGFEEFWFAYPSKVGKPKELTAWRRVKAPHADVMNGLRRWKASEQWTKDKGLFVPHPATRLHREGWNDAIVGDAVREGLLHLRRQPS